MLQSFSALVLILLSGCVSNFYTVDGREFSDMGEALNYQKTVIRKKVHEVSRVDPAGSSLMICLPPDDVLASAKFRHSPRPLNPEFNGYFIQVLKNDAEGVKEGFLRSGLFESVVVKQGEGNLAYAADLGYQYALVNKGESGYVLIDVASGRKEKLSDTQGLNELIAETKASVRKLESGSGASGPSARPAVILPIEEMKYDDATKHGWVSIRGRGLAARRDILKRIAEICATKNKLLVSDDSQTTGTFKVLDEELKDGVLKIYFESMY